MPDKPEAAMEPSARFRGLSVSAGTAAGMLRIVADSVVGDASVITATPDEVAAAFTEVAAERAALAERLRAAGRRSEADIIEIGALIAADPTLSAPAVEAIRGGADVVAAVHEATEQQAVAMERLDNPELAERAGDIRQVAAAVLDRLRTGRANGRPGGPGLDANSEADGGVGGGRAADAGGDAGADTAGAAGRGFILVRREVSPADLIESAEAGLVGAVSVSGGGSSHAAIVARGLGVPMIAGASAGVLALGSGVAAFLDADAGELVVGGEAGERLADAAGAVGARGADGSGAGSLAGAEAREQLGKPPRTEDGREVVVLCNVASAVETRRGLAAGASGVGLLRTELPYTQATDWPSLAQQRAQLEPILTLLGGRTATVRLLDFSGDKIPPFLSGSGAADGELPAGAGLAALLEHPSALADQLRAMLEAGRDAHLAVLIPMVSSLREVSRVRDVLKETAAGLGVEVPALGIMVELASTAMNAAAFASAVDFFSIGTNDLSGDVLKLGRRDPAAGPGLAAHPRVLALVKKVATAGREAGIPVSVCGDSAADARVLPLLIGAGVRTVSVPAARVATVRSWIPTLNFLFCKGLTERALGASTAAEVWDMVPPL